jgi:hypothetical protein
MKNAAFGMTRRLGDALKFYCPPLMVTSVAASAAHFGLLANAEKLWHAQGKLFIIRRRAGL